MKHHTLHVRHTKILASVVRWRADLQLARYSLAMPVYIVLSTCHKELGLIVCPLTTITENSAVPKREVNITSDVVSVEKCFFPTNK